MEINVACTWSLENIAHIATIVMALVAIIAIPIAWHQSSQATKSRRLDAWSKFYDRIGGAEFKKALRENIYSINPDDPEKSPEKLWNDLEQRDSIESVIAVMDDMSRMVLYGILEKDHLFKTYGSTIIRCWHRLRKFVRYRMKNHTLTYVKDYIKVSQMCLKWWKKYLRQVGNIDPNDRRGMPIDRDVLKQMIEEFTIPPHRQLSSSRYVVLFAILPGNAWTSRASTIVSNITNRFPFTNKYIRTIRIPDRNPENRESEN